MEALGQKDETETMSSSKTGKKKDLKDDCESDNGTVEEDGFKITTNCKMK